MNALYGCPLSNIFLLFLEHTILDFLIEFKLNISYELPLFGILFSLHFPLYALVLNLILYHIFFVNLNHWLDSSVSSWFFATHSFFLYFSNLYGYEIDFVSFKDLEQRVFLLYFPDFPKTLFIHVSTTFQRFIFYEYANFMIFHWLNRIFFFLNLVFCSTDSFSNFKQFVSKSSFWIFIPNKPFKYSYGHCWGSIYYSATSFYRHTYSLEVWTKSWKIFFINKFCYSRMKLE